MVSIRHLSDSPEERIVRALKILSSGSVREESVFGEYHSAHEIADRAQTSPDKVREVLTEKLGMPGLRVISVGTELAWKMEGVPRLIRHS